MKKWLVFVFLSVIFLQGFSAPNRLRAYLSYSNFYSPEHGPYLETYLTVLGKSVLFVKTNNGKFQGTVAVTMLFRQNDSIREFRKYELNSPEVDDTTKINFSFLDQQRIPLPAGKYDFELLIADKNQDKPPFQHRETFEINFPKDRISVSGIELIESFTKASEPGTLTKNGFDLMPYMDNFYPASVNKLIYYAEIYNTTSTLKDQPFVISTSIQSFETGKMVNDMVKVKRETPKIVNIAFGEIDISKLASGNYKVVVSVKDKENNELASGELFFQRSNPTVGYDIARLSGVDLSSSFAFRLQNPDSLREAIRCLSPIASGEEKYFIHNQLNNATLEVLQQFFHTFWVIRDPLKPEVAWMNYYDKVLAVDREFHAINKKGYETERGRVYLQYGAPNSRAQSYDEPRAYPYEVWHYYNIGKQSNRRFVFYAPNNATGDFELLHSDVLGELYNPRWEIALHQRDTDRYNNPQDVDRMKEVDHWGKHSDDLYLIPR
jgi:GWxTD domain-containing protein